MFKKLLASILAIIAISSLLGFVGFTKSSEAQTPFVSSGSELKIAAEGVWVVGNITQESVKGALWFMANGQEPELVHIFGGDNDSDSDTYANDVEVYNGRVYIMLCVSSEIFPDDEMVFKYNNDHDTLIVSVSLTDTTDIRSETYMGVGDRQSNCGYKMGMNDSGLYITSNIEAGQLPQSMLVGFNHSFTQKILSRPDHCNDLTLSNSNVIGVCTSLEENKPYLLIWDGQITTIDLPYTGFQGHKVTSTIDGMVYAILVGEGYKIVAFDLQNGDLQELKSIPNITLSDIAGDGKSLYYGEEWYYEFHGKDWIVNQLLPENIENKYQYSSVVGENYGNAIDTGFGRVCVVGTNISNTEIRYQMVLKCFEETALNLQYLPYVAKETLK